MNTRIPMDTPVLIVGAGPTGLTAALELARRNVPVRIIERRDGPSILSRAVGIMPWAMDILDASGAGPLVREASQPTRRLEVWSGSRRAASLRMDVDPDPHVRLFCLPQNETETILASRLSAHGVTVDYGQRLDSIEETEDAVRSTINGSIHMASYVLGADGVRSAVRAHLGQELRGFDLQSKWSIADVDAPEWSEPGVFRVFLRDDGEAIFVIPIGPTRFRAVASVPDALAAMPVPIPVTRVHREGDFIIGIRQVGSYGRRRVWLAGDAAHTHSPVGGRGMNLGIEDAAEWAERLIGDRLERGIDEGYSVSRHVRGQEIIAFTERARRLVARRAGLGRSLALNALGTLGNMAPLNRAIARRMLLT
ncbi:FAD-dependent oxidoreductase [Histidinibacterium aquaticum]|uniref:FAD-dependent oxidoreductase n=1 Tax=Histidinibacterium aquaticum TaxID=2613962 RepID=UPI00168AB203|nr:NAD(P)/FAD-dependent oxidoreductase [Histidinibacterium aquaticum]